MKPTMRAVLQGIALALVLAAGIGCGRQASEPGTESGSRKPRLAYVTNGIASFWVIAEAGARTGASESGAEVDVRMPAEGITDQKRIVEDLLVRGIDGIAISPIDPVNQAQQINDAARQAVLITHDSDAPGTRRLCYVGMDNYKAGRMCGELVKEAMPGGGTVMIFIGRLEQDNARRRRQGLIDELLDRSHDAERYDPPESILNNGRYNILGTLTDQFDRAKAKANAEDTIARHPDLGCMVGLFAYNPPLCVDVLKQAGKLGKVKIVAFDEPEETLQAIKDGHIYGTVVQNPFEYGRRSVQILAGLVRGDRAVLPKDGFLDIPARKILRNNVDVFWNELKQQMAQSNGS